MTTDIQLAPGTPPARLGERRARGGRARELVASHTTAAVAICAIVLGYLVSRVLFVANFPYFYDEALYASWVHLVSNSLHSAFVSELIGREPLLSWAGVVFAKLGFSPLTAMRLVSVSAGLVTVGIVALIGRRLGGALTGIVAAALCVVLPMFVVHDGIGIYEPLVTMIMAIALLVQLDLAQRPRLRTGAVLGVVFAAALLTKENTIPAIVLLPLSLAVFDFAPEGRRQRIKIWVGAVAISLLGVVVAEALLRSSSHYAAYEAVRRSPWYTVRSLSGVLSAPFNLFTRIAWDVFRDTAIGYVTVPLLIIGGAGIAVSARKRPRLLIVLLAWIVVPVVGAIFFTTYPFPRHFMYALPPFVALVAYAAVEAYRWAAARPRRGLAFTGCALLAALALAPTALFDVRVLAHPDSFRYPSLDDWQYVTGMPSGSPWPRIADTIKKRGVGPRVVILTPNADPSVVRELLGFNPRYVFTDGLSPEGRSAQFIYTEAEGGQFGAGGMQVARREHFILVARFVRPRPCDSPRPHFIPPCPRGGEAVLIYERPGLPGT